MVIIYIITFTILLNIDSHEAIFVYNDTLVNTKIHFTIIIYICINCGEENIYLVLLMSKISVQLVVRNIILNMPRASNSLQRKSKGSTDEREIIQDQ